MSDISDITEVKLYAESGNSYTQQLSKGQNQISETLQSNQQMEGGGNQMSRTSLIFTKENVGFKQSLIGIVREIGVAPTAE